MKYDIGRKLTDLELKQRMDEGYKAEHGVYPPKDFWLLARPDYDHIKEERAIRTLVQDNSIYRVCSHCNYMNLQSAFKQPGGENKALRCPKCGMFNVRRRNKKDLFNGEKY